MSARQVKVCLVILIAIAVCFLGCAQQKQAQKGEEIIQKVIDKYNSVKDYSYLREEIFRVNNTTRSVTSYTVVFKKPNKFYINYTKKGIAIIFDGHKEYVYDRSSNEVIEKNLSGGYLLMLNISNFINYLEKYYTFDLVGTQNVSGIKCYVFLLKPKVQMKNAKINLMMWIGDKIWFPVKMAMKIDGKESIVIYKDIKFNLNISDQFFKPPKGAKVVKKT